MYQNVSENIFYFPFCFAKEKATKRAADEDRDDSAADGERATGNKRCHTRDRDADLSREVCAPAAAALPALTSVAEKIQEGVARELALYQTQNPFVASAVLRFHLERYGYSSSADTVATLFKCPLRVKIWRRSDSCWTTACTWKPRLEASVSRFQSTWLVNTTSWRSWNSSYPVEHERVSELRLLHRCHC